MTSIYDLSDPSLARRSTLLSQFIQQEMVKTNRPLPFARFMQLALYHPEWGYYNAETFDFGEQGDFTTAPEISPLFAKCFSRQIQQISQAIKINTVLELGAGSGRLASDLIRELHALGCLPDHYYIYEISPHLRKKQQALLKKSYPNLFSRFIWLDTLPENFSGTILANEVLDALPVNCFQVQEKSVSEKCVSWENNQFIWKLHKPSSLMAKEAMAIRDEYALSPGYEFEINFEMQSFIEMLAHSLNQGIILLADYGYGQREYYHPERRSGTLTCFYQHSKNQQPLMWPSLQDITAHVDFTRVIDKASECGLSLAGYTTQAAFLLACGLSHFVMEEEKSLTPAEEVNLHHAVKLLTLPTEMGERIKFMALSKNVELPLIGFEWQDRRREL